MVCTDQLKLFDKLNFAATVYIQCMNSIHNSKICPKMRGKKKKNRKTQTQTQMPDPNVALHVSYASILQYVFNFGVCFLQLLLMKRGGQVSYAGPLGRNSHKLIEYFEVSIFFHVCSLFFNINVCSLLNQMVRVFPYF